MLLQLAVAADVPAIARLGDEVNALHHAQFPHIFAAPGDSAAHEAFWGERLAKGERFWVAEVDAQVVGFVSAQVQDEPVNALAQPMRPRRIGTLGTIGVGAAWRSRGIGRQLMDTVLAYAQQEGASDLRLNVFLFNTPALGFHERLGFVARTGVMARAVQPAQ
jgi:ribosomal protein S18 acetylase RimI-like enzyme